MKNISRYLAIFMLMLTVAPPRAVAAPDPDGKDETAKVEQWVEVIGDGLYEAACADGVVIRMRRYRPTPEAPFREGHQPVILFPGIIENINEFLPSSNAAPECARRYRDMRLRTPLAQWAQNDPYVAADPMLYFSLAHYLWNQGYDPWFANYRGTGRGAFASDRPDNVRVTLDTWTTLDTPAAIARVVEVTGLKPVIGGHSTGGLAVTGFLQGTYLDQAELLDGLANDYNPHVRSAEDLCRERHSLVRGVIALDPAAIPPMPESIDSRLLWLDASHPRYLNYYGGASRLVNKLGLGTGFADWLVGLLFDGPNRRSAGKQNYHGYAEALNIWNTHDKHPYSSDWVACHVLENTYAGALGQYLDFTVNQTVREHWQNGVENAGLGRGPAPAADDGYYSYLANMSRIGVPYLTLLSAYDGLVCADGIIRDVMRVKAANPLDRYFVLPNTGHMNVYEGYTASMVGYPMIGEWLGQVCGGPANVVAADPAGRTLPGGD